MRPEPERHIRAHVIRRVRIEGLFKKRNFLRFERLRRKPVVLQNLGKSFRANNSGFRA
jgi:hypothetical protein